MIDEIREHYDLLIDEGNDPVLDPPELKEIYERLGRGYFYRSYGTYKIQNRS